MGFFFAISTAILLAIGTFIFSASVLPLVFMVFGLVPIGFALGERFTARRVESAINSDATSLVNTQRVEFEIPRRSFSFALASIWLCVVSLVIINGRQLPNPISPTVLIDQGVEGDFNTLLRNVWRSPRQPIFNFWGAVGCGVMFAASSYLSGMHLVLARISKLDQLSHTPRGSNPIPSHRETLRNALRFLAILLTLTPLLGAIIGVPSRFLVDHLLWKWEWLPRAVFNLAYDVTHASVWPSDVGLLLLFGPAFFFLPNAAFLFSVSDSEESGVNPQSIRNHSISTAACFAAAVGPCLGALGELWLRPQAIFIATTVILGHFFTKVSIALTLPNRFRLSERVSETNPPGISE